MEFERWLRLEKERSYFMDTAEVTFSDIFAALPGFVLFLVTPVVIVVVLFWLVVNVEKMATGVKHRKLDKADRDKPRTFTSKEKALASTMCNNRCEGTGIFFRCRYRGIDLHGDHWFPHSKGGATSPENLVMLCPKCNRSKSDHIPSILQTKALNRRRKKHHDYSGSTIVPVGLWAPKGRFPSYGVGTKKQQISMRPKF